MYYFVMLAVDVVDGADKLVTYLLVECFETVGWAAGRASGL